MADHDRSPGANQHIWQPACQDAGLDGGIHLLLSEESLVLSGWNQGAP